MIKEDMIDIFRVISSFRKMGNLQVASMDIHGYSLLPSWVTINEKVVVKSK